MAYKAPSIESSGIVIPTYNDIIEYMVELYLLWGNPPILYSDYLKRKEVYIRWTLLKK